MQYSHRFVAIGLSITVDQLKYGCECQHGPKISQIYVYNLL